MLDPKHTFDSLMLYGNELTLIVFELLFICTIDYLTESFIADVVFTYLLMEVTLRSSFISYLDRRPLHILQVPKFEVCP